MALLARVVCINKISVTYNQNAFYELNTCQKR